MTNYRCNIQCSKSKKKYKLLTGRVAGSGLITKYTKLS